MAAFDQLLEPDRAHWKLDLQRIQTLVAALDHPERAYPIVLIAGTNGKGSVAAMVERALRAAGRRTGCGRRSGWPWTASPSTRRR